MSPQTPNPRLPEILAPAGEPAALAAALDAGADAVYFGLQQLNARRGAANFLPADLAATVRQVHERGARAYLTLNIDLAQRELGEAARHLELARQARVDAILVRDPALLALRPFFPELDFHFSTQAGISTSAGMAAARELGISRVVLARELSLDEIRAAAAVPGVETEVFVQGALCFCASGRCLLSSWGGGRSGNRGTCTSPCRVAWQIDGREAGRPLSMHDLCLVTHLDALRAAGVRAFKIEGRLKTAPWVTRAVSLYRHALDMLVGEQWQAAATPDELLSEAAVLGAYTGRRLTSGYLDGVRHDLTGDAGRPAAALNPETGDAGSAGADRLKPGHQPAGVHASACLVFPLSASEPRSFPRPSPTDANLPPAAAIRIIGDGKGGLLWQVRIDAQAFEQRTPHQPVRNIERSVTLAEAVTRLAAAFPEGTHLAATELADAELRIPRSTANNVVRDVTAFLRRAPKAPDSTVRIALPPAVKAALAPGTPHAANCRSLGDRPDRVRLDVSAVSAVLPHLGKTEVILDGAAAADLPRLAGSLSAARLVVALPTLFYEADIPAVTALLDACRDADIRVEINSWDGWHLARRCAVRIEAGPGLMVLNALAAGKLGALGCEAVTVSLEADRRQIEELCAAAPVPLSLVVFGRPPLMQTRVEFPAASVQGRVFEDARGVRLRPRLEGSVTVFRPVEPFGLCDLRNPAVRVAHLVADLVASPDPAGEAQTLLAGTCHPRLRFNYERTLR